MHSTALVLADDPVASAIRDRCATRGLEVERAATALDAIQLLLAADAHGLETVVISSEARWATGFLELLEDEFPTLDRVLVSGSSKQIWRGRR